MKYECPEMWLISLVGQDIVTLSGDEGDGGEFDPNSIAPNSIDPNSIW